MKKFLQEYLSFTARERLGIFAVLFMVLLFVIAPFFYPYFIHHKVYDHSQFDKDIASLKIKADTAVAKKYFAANYKEEDDNYYRPAERNYSKPSKAEVFDFDPNTATADDWRRLGVRDKTAETIQKYL